MSGSGERRRYRSRSRSRSRSRDRHDRREYRDRHNLRDDDRSDRHRDYRDRDYRRHDDREQHRSRHDSEHNISARDRRDRSPAQRNPSPARDMPHQRIRQEPLSDVPPPAGSIHQGTVHTVRPFGVFVQLKGFKKHALVHHSQLSEDIRFSKDDEDEDKVKGIEFFFPKGQAVWVKITEVQPDDRHPGEMRVNGSIKVVNQDDGTDLDPSGRMAAGGGGGGGGGPLSEEPPEVGSILRGVVKRIEPYGVFVALQGFRKYGLVHSSQVSNYLSFNREDTDEEKKAELSGVVSIGEQVIVKVVEVIEDEGGRGPKIQCSIKLVDQKTGEDMDPTGLRYKPRGQGGPGGPAGGPIGASAGGMVGGKIDWGYLAGDAKVYGGDTAGKYKMLDDMDEGRGAGPAGRGGAAGPGPGSGLPPAGRGRDMVQPAWMSGGGPGMPGPGGLLLPPPPPISSVDEALAIVQQAAARKLEKESKGKHKKDKKKKKERGKEKEKKSKKSKKSKKEKKSSKRDSSSSSGSSSSDSDS